MKQRYLIDSRVFMDHLCGQKKATKWLIALKDGEGSITARARSEVLVASDIKHREQIKLLLDQYHCISFEKSSSDEAADLCLSHNWSMDDAIQVSLAEKNRLTFVTNNHSGFNKAKGRDILIL